MDGAAVSVLTTTEYRETLAATDATAAKLEDLQFALGEGACLQAATSGCPVLVPDLNDPALTGAWPVFAGAVAQQTSVRALFAFPLQLGTINVGALDLYRSTPGHLRGPELRDVAAAVDAATVLLLDARIHADLDGDSPDLAVNDTPSAVGQRDGYPVDGLWGSRAEVHQATGMILVQLEVSAADAFARLRAYAFARQRPLGEVARDVVARRLVFTEDMD